MLERLLKRHRRKTMRLALVGGSQLFDNDCQHLVDLVGPVLPEHPTVVEIGSWHGQSSVIIGSLVQEKKGTMFCVDTWSGEGSVLQKYAVQVSVFQIFIQNITAARLRETIVPMVGSSEDASLAFVPQSIDLLFFDGDHRYSTFSKDLKLWLPKMKTGGRVMGHDYDRPDWEEAHLEEDCTFVDGKAWHHGVSKAVNEYLPEHKTLGRMWYYDMIGKGA